MSDSQQEQGRDQAGREPPLHASTTTAARDECECHDPEQAAMAARISLLAAALTALPDPPSPPPVLSHYRRLPSDVQQAYDLMHDGAALLHATATKYALVGKMSAAQHGAQGPMAAELERGCQAVAAAALALHDSGADADGAARMGCARSTRRHARRAACAVLHAAVQLIEAFCSGPAADPDSTLGAQRTGVLWEACSVVLDKQLPRGNRSAMRRDLLTYKVECQETLREFQGMLDLGTATGGGGDVREDEDGKDVAVAAAAAADDQWDAFLNGGDDQYGAADWPVAAACVAILKCTRGCLHVALPAMEAVAEPLDNDDNNDDDTNNHSSSDVGTDRRSRLAWLAALHDLAATAGAGVTDLGAALYPPLDLGAVRAQLVRQSGAVTAAVAHCLAVNRNEDDDCGADADALTTITTTTTYTASLAYELPPDVKELAEKVQVATEARTAQALAAIAVAAAGRP